MAKASLGVVVGVFGVGQEIFTRSLKIMYLRKKTKLCNKIVNKKLIGK